MPHAASGGDDLQIPASALACSLCIAFAALFALRTTNTRAEEPEDPEEARDRAGAGHVERLWYPPSPDAALWAREGPPQRPKEVGT
jgi:hypothetical protein